MAGQMRATIFFQDGDFGWTESFFPTVGLGDYAGAQTWAQQYAAVRLPLLCSLQGLGPVMLGYRVSDDTLFRDALVTLIQPPAPGGFSGQPASCFTALLVRLRAAPLFSRPLYLRGLPGSIIDVRTQYNPIPAWLGLFQSFRGFLLGQTGVNVKTTITDPPQRLFKISTINTPNLITTLAPHGFNAGDLVVIKGPARRHNPVGLWTVGPTPGLTTFTLNGCDLPADYVYSPPLSLSAQLKITSYKQVVSVIDERITERKTGRPFGAPRGRRSPHKV
jgi:hypothetical protein